MITYLKGYAGVYKVIQETKKEGDVVIFSHGGPIKAAIGYALGALPNTTLPFG